MNRNWGNPEKFYSAIPESLLYVLRYGGVWYEPEALARIWDDPKALKAIRQIL